jgi:hypothetical protein
MKGTNRQIRGSLTTIKGSSPNSSIMIEAMFRRCSSAAGERSHCGSSCRQSCQQEPAEASNSSCATARAKLSKIPRSLHSCGPIRVFLGSAAPSSPTAPVTADVPLRCIPRTRIACLFAGKAYPSLPPGESNCRCPLAASFMAAPTSPPAFCDPVYAPAHLCLTPVGNSCRQGDDSGWRATAIRALPAPNFGRLKSDFAAAVQRADQLRWTATRDHRGASKRQHPADSCGNRPVASIPGLGDHGVMLNRHVRSHLGFPA